MINDDTLDAIRPCPHCGSQRVRGPVDSSLRCSRGYNCPGETSRTIERQGATIEPLDEAYCERNRVVAALAKIYPSGVARTEIPDWDPCWHGCVYIDLPTGQVSWHYHDRDDDLFAGLPAYDKPWDGHTTKEKYERLAALDYKVESIYTSP